MLKVDGAESFDAAAEDVSEDTAQKVAMFAVSSFECKAAHEHGFFQERRRAVECREFRSQVCNDLCKYLFSYSCCQLKMQGRRGAWRSRTSGEGPRR